MALSKIVSNQEFQQMISYKSLAENEQQKREMKKTLLARVKEAYGDTYYRLKEGTKEAIDMMCWFASERGFVFAGDDYLGDRHEISDRTIRNIAKTLRKTDLILTVYRRSTKHNGRGCPVHLFVDHPYFDYWTSLLQLEFQAGFQAENTESPCESKEEQRKNISTYNLTLKTFIKHNKRNEETMLDTTFVPSNVPEGFILAVQPFFNNANEIYRLWGKTLLAHKISRLDNPVEDLLPIVIKAFKESVFAYKQKRVKKAFTGYFFGSLRNMFGIQKRKEVFERNAGHPLFYNFLEA